MRIGFFVLIATGLFLSLATFILVRYAQGYRINFDTKFFTRQPVTVSSTGLLVATSTPDGASVYINDNLISATDNTIDLAPGDYKVKIVKEGYLHWEKDLKIQKEVVTETHALLIPQAPKLESLTITGVLNPTVDPTGNTIAFGVASASASKKNGVYVLNMSSLPILSLRNSSLQIAEDNIIPLSNGKFMWSITGKELLAETKTKAIYRLKATEMNNNLANISSSVDLLIKQWQEETEQLETSRLTSLKPALSSFIKENFKVLAWSPDETKILYEASASGAPNRKPIPLFIDPPLIGTNSQKETRTIEENKLYVYDTKEDKNFFVKDIDPSGSTPIWFPDNRHFVFVENKQVKIIEYDGTNKTTVYSGPFEGNFVYPWLDGSRLVIVTTLNPQPGVSPNLYTINLK